MNNFDVKDHGVREEMKTGSRRDTQAGKPRYDLIPATCVTKLAMHYGAGSEKYGDRNWEKGQSITRYMSSAERHFQYFKMGLTDENHLMACVWNLFCIDWTLDQIAAGKLPKELDDRTPEMLGGKICTDLFSKIEENVNNKIKCESKNNICNKEKCATKNNPLNKVLENDKNLENVKKSVEKSSKNVTDKKDDVRKSIPIVGRKSNFITITDFDDSFVCIMLPNGKFMNYDADKGITYSAKSIDFFDTGYDGKTTRTVEAEINRLVENRIKYIVVSEDVFDEVNCNGKTGLLYGYNEKTGCLEFVKAIVEIKAINLDKDLLERYKMFTVGVLR